MNIKSSIIEIRSQFWSDTLWGITLFIVLTVPLLFTLETYEKYEIVKLALWMVAGGAGLYMVFKKKPDESTTGASASVPWVFLGTLVFFIGWSIVATLYSVDKLNSVFGFYPRMTNSLLLYFLWACLIIFILIRQTQERFYFLLKVLVFDAFVISVVGIFQSLGFAFYQGLDSSGFQRAPSLLGNANFSSMFIVCVVPIALVFILKTTSFIARIYYGLAIFSFLCAIVMLSSRGSWAGLGAGIIVFVLASLIGKLSKKFWLSGFIVLSVGLGLGYAAQQVTRPGAISQTLQLSEANINLRFLVWDIARQEILQHPFVGTGLANFQVWFERHRSSALANQAGVYDDAHNLFLQIAATGGVPLLLAFLTLLGIAVTSAFRTLKNSHDPSLAACIAGVVAFAVAACFTPVPTGCFVLLAVLISGCFFGYSKTVFVRFPQLSTLCLQTLGAFIVLAGIAFFTSEILFFQGYQAFFQNNFAKSYKLTNAAIHINPTNQYFYLYRIASELGKQSKAPNEIEKEIPSMVAMHGSDESSYIRGANIEYILFKVTGNTTFLQHAIDSMKESIKRDPYFANHYGQTGYFYLELGDAKTALYYDTRNLSLDPSSIPSWMLLARIYQVDNRKTQMLYALERAYALRPDLKILGYLLKQTKEAKDLKVINIPLGVLPSALE